MKTQTKLIIVGVTIYLAIILIGVTFENISKIKEIKNIVDSGKLVQAKWHLPITYYNNNGSCPLNEQSYINKAFNEIANATDNVYQFKEVNNFDDAQIVFNCSDYLANESRFTGRTLGDALYIDEERKGYINLYGFWKVEPYEQNRAEYSYTYDSGYYIDGWCHVGDICKRIKTDYPNYPHVEIHEVLHLFGFDDDYNNTESIMYYQGYASDDTQIEDFIVQELKNLKH